MSMASAQREHDNAYDHRDDAITERIRTEDYCETLRTQIDLTLGKLTKYVDELSKLDGGDYAERPTVDEFLEFVRGRK